MGLDYGNGVTRTLDAIARQFGAVVWQANKPPLDSELNLMAQIDWERMQSLVRSVMPSGFLIDPTRTKDDYEFNKLWSNLFAIGNPRTAQGVRESDEKQPALWANVNGWIIPVAGSHVEADGDLRNFVKLYPCPESDSRIDLVFLEVWQCLVAPNESQTNKPTSSTLWKFGNTQYGGTNLTDDLEDPEVGEETTERVQVQYRLRVYGQGAGLGAGVTLDVYPDGLDDPNILGRGTSATPVSGFQFTNMREDLGDAGLWRAGNGDPNNDLGTVDGYTYAIPVCAIFRRNNNVYVAVSQSGNPNQNGAFDRNPGARLLDDPTDASRILLQASLTNALTATANNVAVQVSGLNGSGLEDDDLVLTSTFLQIEDEVIGISAINVTNGTVTISGRGRYGSAAVGHPAGTPIQFFNSRSDGLFADEVAEQDVLDMRRAVNPGDWDFGRLLEHNLAALAKGELRTTWKGSAAGDTEGPVVHEVSYLHADGNTDNPNHTEALDGPDGIRTIWSDAAVIQPDVTVLLDNDATTDENGVGLTTADQFDTTVRWDVGADFKPVGFLNLGNGGLTDAFTNGSVLFFFIGGETGDEGARGTFRSDARAVRFVMPQEYWRASYPETDPANGNQHPISLRFLTAPSHEPSPPGSISPERHPGPMYPWRELNFERPFIVLGGLLNSALKVENVPAANLVDVSGGYEIDVDLDFDEVGAFYSLDANNEFESDPSAVGTPLLRGQRTLFDMLTDYGRDRTGGSSEVYVVVYGDQASTQNNGAFRVVGAGTVGYTERNAASATRIVVVPLSADFNSGTGFEPATGNTVTVEFRSQYHNAEDTSNYEDRTADLALVFTDLGGESNHPWNKTTLGQGSGTYDTSFYPVSGITNKVAVSSKLLVSTTLLYHPGRGGAARVPDEIVRFAIRGATQQSSGTYLQKNKALIDTTFSAFGGTPTDEIHYDPVHVQTWNRLPALGWHAPTAPNYGGNVVGFTEIDRESQLFFDKGSKTFIFRPFRDREMTLQTVTFTATQLGGATNCLLGTYTYPSTVPKDGLQLFTGTTTTGKRMVFAVPREFMPRFGRQDIPYYVDTQDGEGTFLPGINHLFSDSANLTEPVFNIIGGQDNTTGGNEVKSLYFVTGTPTDYGTSDTVIGVINNKPNYEARKTTDIDPDVEFADEVIASLAAVNSSDFGRGLRGIQLPPYLGIARLLGVYELEDYKSKGGRTFKTNRYEVEDDPATNLLRQDATKQTLFILRDGAKDLTGQAGDHTYIVPENVLDLSRIPSYASGDDFDDFDYVVEATVFGFAKNWINGNNFVLVRKHNGQGGTNTDGGNVEVEGVHMCIPCPAGFNEQVYAAYNRTVYQGDPFMTRHGETRTTTDYEHRYGQLPMSGQNALRTPVQQYDENGDFVPQKPNPRVFEVLASMDFYTTLGTGKVGGRMFPGTMLDVGFTEDTAEASTRMPAVADQPAWRILPRAFTEGQKENTSRATAVLEFRDNEALIGANTNGDFYEVAITTLDGDVVRLWGAVQADVASIVALANVDAEDVFVIDQTSKSRSLIFDVTGESFGNLKPDVESMFQEIELDSGTYPQLEGLSTSQPVSITVTPKTEHSSDYGAVVFQGRVAPGGDALRILAIYTPTIIAFDTFADPARNIRKFQWNPPDIVAGGVATTTVAWAGVDPALDQVVLVNMAPTDGLEVRGYVSAANQITLVLRNFTAGNINLGDTTFTVAVLDEVVPDDWAIDMTDVDFTVEVTILEGDVQETISNFATVVNAHPGLQRTLKARVEDPGRVLLTAEPVGARGNEIHVAAKKTTLLVRADTETLPSLGDVLRFSVPQSAAGMLGAKITATFLAGGEDIPVNAGDGTSQLKLTGMTERLPLGVLLQDSDFLGENPLRDRASAAVTSPAGLRPVQSLLPLTEGGNEYTRFTGAPGELVGLADGAISTSSFVAWTTETPTGTKRFRIFRGGGAAFVMHGENPGGPLDWVSGSWPDSLKPVLKGGVLVCRAMLVRNFYEEAFSTPYTVSEGDEIQMVMLTYGILGNGQTVSEGVTLDGIISPSGYGEGYAAADRYRLHGRPMFRGHNRTVPNPSNVALAVYDENTRVS